MARTPQTVAFEVRGPLVRADLPALCDRVCALFAAARPRIAFCAVVDVEPDAVAVDALARLQLAAQRSGCRVYLRGASTELLELVELMALTDVLPVAAQPAN